MSDWELIGRCPTELSGASSTDNARPPNLFLLKAVDPDANARFSAVPNGPTSIMKSSPGVISARVVPLHIFPSISIGAKVPEVVLNDLIINCSEDRRIVVKSGDARSRG